MQDAGSSDDGEGCASWLEVHMSTRIIEDDYCHWQGHYYVVW